MKGFIVSLLFIFSLVFNTLLAQDLHPLLKEKIEKAELIDSIQIENGSFEELDSLDNKFSIEFKVHGWNDIGTKLFANETPPTIHKSNETGEFQFGVKTKPHQGDVFVSLVTRENETYESIGVKLNSNFKKDHTYLISFYTALSETYLSPYPENYGSKSFSKPISLKVHIRHYVENSFEVASIDLNADYSWKENVISFKSPCYCDFLSFEVRNQGEEVYNGHVLVDSFSDIYEIFGKK